MRHCNCYDRDDAAMRMFAGALLEAMTEHYAVFRKSHSARFLFWVLKHEETVDVHIPKHHRDNYEENLMAFKKECITLIDKGYTNGNVTDEIADRWRLQISEYQQKKSEVWE